jgi:hypothetical protein
VNNFLEYEEAFMKKLFPVVIVAAVFTIFFFISCSLMVKEEIVYEVSSSSATEANITYTDSDGNSVSLYGEPIKPQQWTKTIKITFGEDKELEEVSLTATTSDTTTADVKATITWKK